MARKVIDPDAEDLVPEETPTAIREPDPPIAVAPDESPRPKTLIVHQVGGEIVVFDGNERASYKVTDGEIVVPDAHVNAVLGAIAGATIKPEVPAKDE